MKMETRRAVLLIAIALLPILLFSNGSFGQTKGAKETIFLSGIVKEVSWDHQSIVINGRKFFISGDTRVEDQKGNRLRLGDVKINLEFAIDAIQNPNGYTIKKIVVITDRGV
jgi:hypothetical protein